MGITKVVFNLMVDNKIFSNAGKDAEILLKELWEVNLKIYLKLNQNKIKVNDQLFHIISEIQSCLKNTEYLKFNTK